MSPEQIGAITALFGLIERVSGWPVWFLLCLMMIGPWAAIFILDRNHERRYAAQRKMYEDNVLLLKETQSIARDLREIVIINTQAFQKLDDAVEKNQFCPMVRQAGRGG